MKSAWIKRLFVSAFAALFCLSKADAGEINFRTQIIPILSKAGCNAGACHGAATGQGGFHLSLLGYDPEQDYWTITRERTARRVDVDAPSESLFLKKATRQIEHEGGRRIKRGSVEYQTLLDWVKCGVQFGAPELQVTKIQVGPIEVFLRETNQQAHLQVKAFLSDGREEDVTSLALYSSNDDGIATVSSSGTVTTHARGVTSIMVRYSGQVAATRLMVPYSEAEISDYPASNFIDEEVHAELQRLGLPASTLAGDAEFLRRASLDLTGRLPAPELAREIMARGGSGAVRGEIITNLLGSEEFVGFWTMKLADLLLISGKRGSEKASLVYYNWLRDQVAQNKSWKEIAQALVTARGDINEHGPANFYMLATDPRDMAEKAGTLFLGTQIGCARCHAHPSDRWTQRDYYQFSAFFAGVSRDGNKVSLNDRHQLEFPKTKIKARPKPLGAPERPSDSEDARRDLAEWMVSDDNPMFARAFVNRIWQHLFGRGLFEPADDLRPTNPASLPKLVDRLALEFKKHEYDLRWLVGTIANSRTYQLSSRANAINQNDHRFFSRAYLKPLSGPVLLDAVCQVTGVPEQFSDQPEGITAVQLPTAQTPSYALDVLGRCKREDKCEPARSGGGLAQALHLINGTTINSRLARAVELFQREEKSDQAIVENVYLSALTRYPAVKEASFWKKTLAEAPNKNEVLEDFLWTVLNCREFGYNH